MMRRMLNSRFQGNNTLFVRTLDVLLSHYQQQAMYNLTQGSADHEFYNNLIRFRPLLVVDQ